METPALRHTINIDVGSDILLKIYEMIYFGWIPSKIVKGQQKKSIDPRPKCNVVMTDWSWQLFTFYIYYNLYVCDILQFMWVRLRQTGYH